MSAFLWWRLSPYGTAEAHPDTVEVRKRVDTEPGWYGTVEGLVIHAGVQATCFTRKVEKLFDAAAWLHRGEHIPAGERTTIRNTITGAILCQSDAS